MQPTPSIPGALHATQLTKAARLKRKEKDDVLGGADEWKNVAQSEGATTCMWVGAWHPPTTPHRPSVSRGRPPPPRTIPDAATCPKCQHDKAYYKELQTRSADEPATLFFKCVQCSHQWREG